MKDKERISLLLPAKLRKQLEASAKKENRTLSGQIRYILELVYADKESK